MARFDLYNAPGNGEDALVLDIPCRAGICANANLFERAQEANHRCLIGEGREVVGCLLGNRSFAHTGNCRGEQLYVKALLRTICLRCREGGASQLAAGNGIAIGAIFQMLKSEGEIENRSIIRKVYREALPSLKAILPKTARPAAAPIDPRSNDRRDIAMRTTCRIRSSTMSRLLSSFEVWLGGYSYQAIFADETRL